MTAPPHATASRLRHHPQRRNIDALEKDLDRLCLEFIARQQPVAGLLRFAHATFKIALELERVGDYAESIAKQIVKLADQPADIPLDRFHQMADLSIPMLHDAMQAYVSQDAELARRTAETERTVDALKSGLTRELMMRTRTEDLPFDALNPLIVVAKRLERFGSGRTSHGGFTCARKTEIPTRMSSGSSSWMPQFLPQPDGRAIASAMHLQDFISPARASTLNPSNQYRVVHGNILDISRMAPKAINMCPSWRVRINVALSPGDSLPQHPKKIVPRAGRSGARRRRSRAYRGRSTRSARISTTIGAIHSNRLPFQRRHT